MPLARRTDRLIVLKGNHEDMMVHALRGDPVVLQTWIRLGGDATTVGGSSVIVPSEDNRSVLAMWAGATAPLPPTTTFGPGCRTGHPLQ